MYNKSFREYAGLRLWSWMVSGFAVLNSFVLREFLLDLGWEIFEC